MDYKAKFKIWPERGGSEVLGVHSSAKLPCRLCEQASPASAQEESWRRKRNRARQRKNSFGPLSWKRTRESLQSSDSNGGKPKRRCTASQEAEVSDINDNMVREHKGEVGESGRELHTAMDSSSVPIGLYSNSVATSSGMLNSSSSSQCDLQALGDAASGSPNGQHNFSNDAFDRKYKQTLSLCRGGYGMVYAGHRLDDSLPVAIKRVPESKVSHTAVTVDGRLQHYPMEVLLLLMVGACEDSSRPVEGAVCVQLMDWYEVADELVLVMERPVPCMDLFDYVNHKGGQLSEEEAKFIFKQLVELVLQVHAKGVLHRDIKPENILILTGQEPLSLRILDFGCGCLLKDEPYTEFYGTEQYIPPEWYLRGEYEAVPLSVWQLGVLLYDMLFGVYPFLTQADIICQEPYISQHLSRHAQDMMRRCLAKRPGGRPTLERLLQHPWLH